MAENGIVLLKNDRNTLPLDRGKVKTIVVLGPNATSSNGGMPANIGGGGSGAVATFAAHYAEASYLEGIKKLAGSNINVIYLPMPAAGTESPPVLANAMTAAQGQPGLTLNVVVTGDGPPVEIPATVQTSINTTWQAGQLPFGVPTNRDATFTWSGVLMAPKDSDWQLVADGNPVVVIDGAADAPGTIIHLQGNKPSPVNIQLRAQANPPAGRGARARRGGGGGGGGFGGRGGRGGGGPMVRVAFVPPAIPDLAVAKSADAVVVCVGLNSGMEAEGRDRAFELPELQQYLINAACKINPRPSSSTTAARAWG